ncbi:MAG: TIGR04282 family arsenosugar biosynthesis glycosyltransferase [Erythrobacter sp.]|nr:TIGR04282 family arsenosugar biosynthesis glycosyltransferase [Erythrobacter sp.]
MEPSPHLVLFARFPVAGQCKTRLIPAVGAEGAAAIHKHLTERTVRVLRGTGATVTIATTGAPNAAFENWLGPGLEFSQQVEGDLTDRLLAFVDHAPVVFLGADTPDLDIEIVQAAIDGLATHPVVIGPAEDGGYYLIAMRDPLPELFIEMPWSTAEVLPETLRRLRKLEIEPLLLEALPDCDRPEDLARWPNLAAGTK